MLPGHRCRAAVVLQIDVLSPKLPCKKQGRQQVHAAVADVLQIPILFGNVITSTN